jgi:2'-hydroxyisoflavone reductase
VNILILGGTRFVGRHLMERAAHDGHAVTLFHRGQTPCERPAGVGEVLGDRETADILKVADRAWDLVVDTCGYFPQTVERSVEALRAHARRYVFISSISVYANAGRPGLTEDDDLLQLPAGLPERPDVNEYYGALKVRCEHVVREAFGIAATIVRPGLIVGPYDPTDRFTYWVERLAAGGEVLAPGDPSTPVQFIDARDLAAFVLELAKHEHGGVFNATGPAETLTMQGFLEAGETALASREPVRLRWCPDAVLLEQGIKPWSDLPLWIPAGDPDSGGLLQTDVSKPIAAGLRVRPVENTFADTHAWALTLPPGRERKAGLSSERERAALLAAAG